MHHCPHCGAALRENARFCPICMTALNQKRVVPTPKYFPLRWLSLAAAVLVFVAAVWGGFRWWPQGEQAAIAPPATKTATTSTATTTTTGTAATTTLSTDTALTTTLTTLAETFSTSMESTATTTTTRRSISYPTYATIPTAPRVTTASTTVPTTASTVAPTTTTTTTKKTTTTTTGPTYPAVWDTQAVYYTEEGEAFEEVKWTYKSYWYDTFTYYIAIGLPRGISKTCCYNIPLSECIVVTGFEAPTSNGYYRIPPVIDGKVVIGVDMQTDVAGACQFNDADIAPTVKIITFPTEMLFLTTSTINQCTNLERLYFDCSKLYMDSKALPKGSYDTPDKDLLRIYGNPDILNDYNEWWLRTYCEYTYDNDTGVYTNYNKVVLYDNVCHYYTEDLNYFDQLYPYLS